MPVYANWRLKVMDRSRPEPLPFPPNGGCWAPLVDYLPEKNAPAVPLHRFFTAHKMTHLSILFSCIWCQSQIFFFPLRCNIAVILLTDLIVDHGVKVEWSAYIHLLLHAVFIGILLTIYTLHCIYLPEIQATKFSSVFLFGFSLLGMCKLLHNQSLYSVYEFFQKLPTSLFLQGLITSTQKSTSTANAFCFICSLSKEPIAMFSLWLWCCYATGTSMSQGS